MRFDGHVFYYENAANPNKVKFNVEPDDVVIEKPLDDLDRSEEN